MKYLGRNVFAGAMRGKYFDNTPQGSYSSRAPRATNKRTPKQIHARAILSHAAQSWKKLSAAEKATWNNSYSNYVATTARRAAVGLAYSATALNLSADDEFTVEEIAAASEFFYGTASSEEPDVLSLFWLVVAGGYDMINYLNANYWRFVWSFTDLYDKEEFPTHEKLNWHNIDLEGGFDDYGDFAAHVDNWERDAFPEQWLTKKTGFTYSKVSRINQDSGALEEVFGWWEFLDVDNLPEVDF